MLTLAGASTNPVLFGGLGLLAFLALITILKSFIRVCPTNQILVITGAKTNVSGKQYGFRIQRGGWTTVIPFIQGVERIDLGIIPINVQIENVNSANGITVGADATACVCVDDTVETQLYQAIQQLLGKSREQITDQIQQTMVGNFRAALNKTTPLQAIGMVESADNIGEKELTTTTTTDVGINIESTTDRDSDGERALFRSVLLQDCREDLSTFGIDVVSVSLQRIWDTSNYISNLANKTLSKKRQDVEIEETGLKARAEQAESDSERLISVSQSKANEEILAIQQDVDLFTKEAEAQISQAGFEATSSVEKSDSEGQRRVQELSVELQKLKNQSEITIPAEAERRAAEIMAEGEAKSVEITEVAKNELLQQKAELLTQAGDIGKIALFFTKIPSLFDAYAENAKDLKVNNLLVLNEKDGFNSAVNRGPAAFVDFLYQFEKGFGISVRQLMTQKNSPHPRRDDNQILEEA